MRLARFAPFALVALLAGAAAPSASLPEDPQATVVADLVVRARTPGPAWWRVSSGAASIWVLGVPAALPKGLAWDRSTLERRLGGARRVLLPPTASFGLLDVFGAFSVAAKLRAQGPFEASLPPALADRYAADAALLRQAAAHYDRWKPAVAGLLMVADFRRQAGLDAGQPIGAIRTAAARARVPAAPAISYPAVPLARSIAAELSDAVNEACLADALEEIEAGAAHVRAAAEAWAAGDVAGALAAERGYERCVAALPDGAALARRTMADEAGAISRAMQAGGTSIAVVELRTLLARGGVLDRLRADGYAVSTPDQG